jgi:hypothetical protein
MEAAALADQLEEEGFAVDRGTGTASFSKTRFPCTLRWHVRWTSREGIVEAISAGYGGSCL